VTTLKLADLDLHDDVGRRRRLPDELVSAINVFNAKTDAMPSLLSALQRLTGSYQEADRMLNEVRAHRRELDHTTVSRGWPRSCIHTYIYRKLTMKHYETNRKQSTHSSHNTVTCTK
jgi:citrate synthase